MLDITGHKYGKLTALSPEYIGKLRAWRCRCDCGVELVVVTGQLRHTVRHCGCSHGGIKHGQIGTKTYSAWSDMKARCGNPDHPSYKNYGGRGIVVCDQWQDSFESFLDDMDEAPPGLTLERVDNEGDYEPGNCRWVDRAKQARNRRDTRLVTIGGETMCMVDWARRAGVSPSGFKRRLDMGWPDDMLLSPPDKSRPKYSLFR